MNHQSLVFLTLDDKGFNNDKVKKMFLENAHYRAEQTPTDRINCDGELNAVAVRLGELMAQKTADGKRER